MGLGSGPSPYPMLHMGQPTTCPLSPSLEHSSSFFPLPQAPILAWFRPDSASANLPVCCLCKHKFKGMCQPLSFPGGTKELGSTFRTVPKAFVDFTLRQKAQFYPIFQYQCSAISEQAHCSPKKTSMNVFPPRMLAICTATGKLDRMGFKVCIYMSLQSNHLLSLTNGPTTSV